MGWDAYAVMPDATIDSWGSCKSVLDASAIEAFRLASLELKQRVGIGSDQLEDGTLGGLSQEILARATPIPCYDEKSKDGCLQWSPEIVKKANALANWDLSLSDLRKHPMHTTDTAHDVLTLIWETRIFLDACARNGLGIIFTW